MQGVPISAVSYETSVIAADAGPYTSATALRTNKQYHINVMIHCDIGRNGVEFCQLATQDLQKISYRSWQISSEHLDIPEVVWV